MVRIHRFEDKLSFLIELDRLDSTNAAEIALQLQVPEGQHFTSVEIDLSQVEAMDSSGIGVLLHLHKSLPPSVQPLVLRQAQPSVASVIELLRLHRVFELHCADSA